MLVVSFAACRMYYRTRSLRNDGSMTLWNLLRYYRCWWTGLAQTIYAMRYAPRNRVPFTVEHVDCPDGETACVLWPRLNRQDVANGDHLWVVLPGGMQTVRTRTRHSPGRPRAH